MARRSRISGGDIEQRRETFAKTAAKLFLKKGYHSTTLDDVARDLNVTKGSVYYYIRSKRSLLFESYKLILGLAAERLKQCMEKVQDEPPDRRLREMIITHILFLTDEITNMWAISYEYRWLRGRARSIVENMRREYEAHFVQAVEQGMQMGIFRCPAAKVAVKLMFGALNAIPIWLDPDDPLSNRQVAEFTADFMLAGLRAGWPAAAEPRGLISSSHGYSRNFRAAGERDAQARRR